MKHTLFNGFKMQFNYNSSLNCHANFILIIKLFGNHNKLQNHLISKIIILLNRIDNYSVLKDDEQQYK